MAQRVTGMAAMTDEALIGQRFMVGFDGRTPSPGILELIGRRRVGGVILFSRNIGGAEDVARLTLALQRAAHEAGHPAPLLLGIDQENGPVRRLGPDATSFPGNMALGAADDVALTEEIAGATGRELLALGVNMNFAPVVDVASNPANPVGGARSFGDDSTRVARHAAASVRGYQRAGVIATLKHFPGHGDTTTDSHLALPVLPHGLERLRAVEFAPFRAGIEAGAAAVMTAHIALPAVTGAETLPATLSEALLRDVLRGELGFTGVVITDCLEMRAISRGMGTVIAGVEALNAGADIALISHHEDVQRAALDHALEAVRTGALSRDALRAGAGRVLALKRRHLSWERALRAGSLDVVGCAAHRALAERAFTRAVTLIRDMEDVLPLRVAPGERLLVVELAPGKVGGVVDREGRALELVEALRQWFPQVEGVALSPDAMEDEQVDLERRVAEAGPIILVTRDTTLHAAQVERARVTLRGKRVIGVALGAPYDAALFPQAGAYLAVYDEAPAALDVAARVIAGELKPQGRLPVKV